MRKTTFIAINTAAINLVWLQLNHIYCSFKAGEEKQVLLSSFYVLQYGAGQTTKSIQPWELELIVQTKSGQDSKSE